MKVSLILKPDHLEQPKAPEGSHMERLGQILNREGAAWQQEVQSIAAVHTKNIVKVFP